MIEAPFAFQDLHFNILLTMRFVDAILLIRTHCFRGFIGENEATILSRV
jgi:hypothetical protein